MLVNNKGVLKEEQIISKKRKMSETCGSIRILMCYSNVISSPAIVKKTTTTST